MVHLLQQRDIKRLGFSIQLLVLLLLQIDQAICTVYNTSFSGVTWDNDDWVLQTTQPDPGRYESRGNLANGYIGINVASLGPFYDVDDTNGSDINGWPLFDRRQSFATVAGFFDVQATTNGTNFEWLNQLGGESVISGLPHWSGLVLESNGSFLDAFTDLTKISGFQSSLDMKNGMMNWSYTWAPSSDTAFDVAYTLFLHKLYINQAVTQVQVTGHQDANINVIDLLQGDCAVRTFPLQTQFENATDTIWSAVQPDNIPYVTAYVASTVVGDKSVVDGTRMTFDDPSIVGSNSSGIAQQYTLDVKAGCTSTIEKYVGIASSDQFEDAQEVAMTASLNASQTGFKSLLESHSNEWQSVLAADFVEDYSDPTTGLLQASLVEEQILGVTDPFYLLQNTISQNAFEMAGSIPDLRSNSISVSGLSSSSYAGLIFWDVEVWMSPGLSASFPDTVQQVANYRAARYQQAKDNIETQFITSQNDTSFSPDSAIFPWTSGRFGNCTGTGPCFDYEYHINGDISLELANYYFASGDVEGFMTNYYPIFSSIASTYADLLSLNETTNTYMLHNATDPDEYANMIDNPGYTMVLIQTRLNEANSYATQFQMPMNQTWADRAASIEIPTSDSADIILEYTGMNGSISVKQADVTLIDDLLDYQNTYTQGDFDFYTSHQSLNGPGMTFANFAIVTAAFAPSGCSAYTYDLYSSRPYIRAPWYQFSEQITDDYNTNGGTHPAYPFLTGVGGAYRVPVFGWLGLRLQQNSFNVNPSPPLQIPDISYRIIYWQGYAIKATSNLTHTTFVRRSDKDLTTANPAYTSSIPVTVGYDTQTIYNLTVADPLILPNRQSWRQLTTPNNIAQCALSVSANTTELPGQYPLAAIDGVTSTAWRPENPNVTSTLLVDLSTNPLASGPGYYPISGFMLDWGQNPPTSFSIAFANTSTSPDSGDAMTVHADQSVAVSLPYDAKTVDQLVPYSSNTTNVTLEAPVWSGRYGMLSITGNQNTLGDGGGAACAEWAIVKAG